MRGGGQVKGWEEHTTRLGPRDPRIPGRVIGDSHGALKSKSI